MTLSAIFVGALSHFKTRIIIWRCVPCHRTCERDAKKSEYDGLNEPHGEESRGNGSKPLLMRKVRRACKTEVAVGGK